MKAVVYHKPKDMRVENVDDPKIQEPRDAIIRVTTAARTCICITGSSRNPGPWLWATSLWV